MVVIIDLRYGISIVMDLVGFMFNLKYILWEKFKLFSNLIFWVFKFGVMWKNYDLFYFYIFGYKDNDGIFYGFNC